MRLCAILIILCHVTRCNGLALTHLMRISFTVSLAVLNSHFKAPRTLGLYTSNLQFVREEEICLMHFSENSEKKNVL